MGGWSWRGTLHSWRSAGAHAWVSCAGWDCLCVCSCSCTGHSEKGVPLYAHAHALSACWQSLKDSHTDRTCSGCQGDALEHAFPARADWLSLLGRSGTCTPFCSGFSNGIPLLLDDLWNKCRRDTCQNAKYRLTHGSRTAGSNLYPIQSSQNPFVSLRVGRADFYSMFLVSLGMTNLVVKVLQKFKPLTSLFHSSLCTIRRGQMRKKSLL